MSEQQTATRKHFALITEHENDVATLLLTDPVYNDRLWEVLG